MQALPKRGSTACIPRWVDHSQAGKCPDLILVKPRLMPTRRSLCISGRYSLNIPQSSSRCRLNEAYLRCHRKPKGHQLGDTNLRRYRLFGPVSGENEQRLVARAPSLRGRGAVCLLAWTQPAAHCASFPIGPPAGAPRSAVLAGKFSNRRPVVQINPGGFEHIACRFRSARCHRQPLPQAP